MKRHVIAVLAALLVLSACSAEAEPKTEPTPTPTPSASATPSEEPLRTDTPEATIRSWFAEFDDAQNSGQTKRLASMATDSCDLCAALVDLTETTYSEGGRIQAGPVVLTSLTDRAKGSPRGKLVRFDATVRAGSVVVTGKSPRSFPGGEERYELTLQLVGNSWLISHFVRLDPR